MVRPRRASDCSSAVRCTFPTLSSREVDDVDTSALWHGSGSRHLQRRANADPLRPPRYGLRWHEVPDAASLQIL
jgi:hypothetical protein